MTLVYDADHEKNLFIASSEATADGWELPTKPSNRIHFTDRETFSSRDELWSGSPCLNSSLTLVHVKSREGRGESSKAEHLLGRCDD